MSAAEMKKEFREKVQELKDLTEDYRILFQRMNQTQMELDYFIGSFVRTAIQTPEKVGFKVSMQLAEWKIKSYYTSTDEWKEKTMAFHKAKDEWYAKQQQIKFLEMEIEFLLICLRTEK